MAVARKADALIEAGGEEGERLRLHRVPLEAFSTVYSFLAALGGYEGKKWDQLTTTEAEDQVLSLRSLRGWTFLHWAANDDSRAKLAGVIAARKPGLANAKENMSGDTPLHYAAMRGREAMARVLLAVGADKKAQNNDGLTPLHMAMNHRGEAVVRELLAAGADKHAKNNDGDTPLHLAGSEAVARVLLAAGADKHAKNYGGCTPLHKAARSNNEEMARTLLAAGADKHAQDAHGNTPLHLAQGNGWNPLNEAQEKNHEALMALLS